MISDTTVKVAYACDGDVTTFPITFEFLDSSHVAVFLRTLLTGEEEELGEGVDYYIEGSNVITYVAYSDEYSLTVMRVHPSTQTLDLVEGGTLPADSLEERLDRVVQVLQQHDEKLSRALLLPHTSEYSNITHPEPEDEHFMIWRDGKLVNVQHFSGADTIVISVFMDGFLESATAQDARDHIGALGANDVKSLIREDFTATAGQTVFDTTATYTPGGIIVAKNGLVMRGGGEDYTETDSNTITFAYALEAGDRVTVLINITVSEVGGGASSLAELDDVELTDLADGDMLMYDAATEKWVNGGVISLEGPF